MTLCRPTVTPAPWLRSLVCACTMGAVSASAQAPTDLRLALVIGNSAYAGVPLLNPANDAKAMSNALRGMGFTVIDARDASKQQMEAAIGQARDALKGRNGVGMLYYAGHGLQLDWRNYMVPVDARFAGAADVPAHAVDVQQVIEAFRAAGNRMNIVVLDACRDNPFTGTASGKGLAQMDAPPGTLLAYATAPGNVAEDGDAASGNGLYTRFLVQEIQQPGARIEDVFKRVRFQVRERSQGRQIPWESTSLEDDFYFGTGIKPFVRPDNKAREQAFNQEKADWDRIANSTNAEDFYAFLKKYPNGNIAELAQSRLERLQAALVKAQPDRDGKTAADLTRRYRDGDRFEFVIKDGLTGVSRNTASVVVKSLGDDIFEGSGPGYGTVRATQAGFVLQDGAGTYDPPWAVWPGSEYQVGKRWSARTIQTGIDGNKQWIDVETHIVAHEKVTVPLGTFDTYRIEVTMVYQRGGRAKLTFWDDPGWGYSVKMSREFRVSGRAPDIFIREMTARSRGG